MNLTRMFGVTLRYAYILKRNLDRLVDYFYWILMDLLIWGLTSFYIEKINPDVTNFTTVILSGLMFWLVIWRANYEINVNLLEEFWSRNLINIFVSPLKFYEYLTTLAFLGLFNTAISFVFASAVAYFLYHFGILIYGLYLVPLIFLLMMTGWAAGFFISGLILRYGTKVQTFAWTLVTVLYPFSAVYYPVSYLPDWGEWIARAIPTSYLFESIRGLVTTGVMNWNNLLISLILNIIYLTLAIWFINASFKKTINRGLVNIH